MAASLLAEAANTQASDFNDTKINDEWKVIGARLFEAVRQNVEPADKIRGYTTTLRPDGTWPDVVYTDRNRGGWKARPHLERTVNMAKAYRTAGHALYQDANLKQALLRAYDAWFTVIPKGEKNLLGTPESDNWWHNEFGGVTSLQNVFLLMGDEMGDARLKSSRPALNRFWPGEKGGAARDKGDNLFVRTFLGMRLAYLTRDAAFMNEMIARTIQELGYSADEGVHRDHSFRTHNVLYSMHYGLGYVLHPTDTLLMVRGTRFAPAMDKIKLLSDFVLEGQAWQFRKGWMDYATTGRAHAEEGYQPRRQRRMLDSLNNLLAINAPREAEITALVARIEKDTATGEPAGNRHYWRGDMMVHKRASYHVSIHMASKRIRAVELINGQGVLGYYFADGVMSLQRRGPEYSNLMPVWDWTRLPGVTCPTATRPPDITTPDRYSSGGHREGVGEFVGGVSDGRFGAAVLDYDKDGVRARKSWFFFDDEFVCLGAGITSAGGANVRTSVNQCHLNGIVTTIENDKTLTFTPDAGHPLPGVAWVHHDAVGYVFPAENGAAVAHLKTDSQTGHWRRVNTGASDAPVSANVFGLWLDHGARPQNATYAYIVVPEISASKLAEYAKTPSVRILANTPALQAVMHETGKITQAIFHEPGTLTIRDGLIVTVDQPCALLLRETGRLRIVSVSDPKQTALRVTVTVNTKRLVYELPKGELAGQTLRETFKNEFDNAVE